MKEMILVFLLLGMTCAQVTRTNNRFLRFDDSFEKDSDENVFIGGNNNNNGIQRARFDDDDDSDERVFFRSPTTATTTTNHFNIPRQNFASPVRNTFSTSNRNTFSSPSTSNTFSSSPTRSTFPSPSTSNTFSSPTTRNTFGSTPIRQSFGTSNNNNNAFISRFDDDDDSDERFFGRSKGFKSNVNNRNRFDDSRESFRKPNSFSFGNNNLNKRTRFDDSDEVKSSFRNTFNRNTNSFQTKHRIDSVEDLFEDLFDNDLDDRVRAQNTLSSLGFGSQANNRGLTTSFNTKLGSDRFSNNVRTINNPILSSTNNNRFNNNAFGSTSSVGSRFAPNRETTNVNTKFNPIDHFRVNTGTTKNNRFGTTTNNFGTSNQFGTNNQFNTNNAKPNNIGAFSFGTSLGNPDRFNTPKQTSSVSNTNRLNTFNTNNRIPINNNNSQRSSVSNKKTSTGSLSNSVKSDPFSNVKRSEFFPNTPGFNWPGGNGYYVRMSTGNSKPFSYFVKYDD